DAHAKYKQHGEAIAAYQQVIELNPDAIPVYKSLLEIQPENWELWSKLGDAHAKYKQHGEAIAAYQQVIELNPDEALKVYENLAELQPDNEEIWSELGNLYANQNHPQEAIAAYQQMLKVNPESVEAYQKMRQIQPESWESWFNLDNLSKIEIYKALGLGVEYVAGSDVEGDIAEFGTMFGNTAKFLAYALSRTDSNPCISLKLSQMKLYLFDSFQGLPDSTAQPDIESPHVKTGIWGPGACKGSSKQQVLDICKRYLPESRIEIYEGWFKDTISQLPGNIKFSMMHVDSDLYQSAIDVLDTCFARGFVQEGTIIFFDDWNCNRASPKFGERRAWLEIQQKYAVDFSELGSYSTGGYRIIVHSYRISNNL
ncbi:tetratricopeptide repeat protein, partial [Microcoleus sp. B4-C1]|uniref:tetratricopeptide repeat protein n=1 Tax=Microcoleus sp. B4-C1 TaxID=2818660 RepID=UPI002FCF66B8